MPRDLFSDIVRPSIQLRSRKSSAFPLAVVVHLAGLLVLIIAPLVATDILPVPHRVLEFVPIAAAPAPPPPAAPPSAVSSASARAASPDAAPLEAPDRIGEEVEPVGAGVEAFGVPGGVPGGIDLGVELPPAPPPPPAVARQPLRPGGAIKSPKKIKEVLPVYPAIARAARVGGTVILEAIIDETGSVRDVRVLRSIPLLDAAAIDAVRQWQFTPALLNGQPVPVVMTVTVAFTLR